MKLIVLTLIEADEIRGIYKLNHACEPVMIEIDMYILHEGMKDIKEFKDVFKDKPRFDEGDDSTYDKKYKAKKDKDKE